ncbi:MAG: bifunctional UDP-N-acetylglucosamine diphosphorylase/glucosamine-1-phosphate N-acetyltransferase GlmU [Alphaproteobacteria bacterium]|nr:bifunctional UDP-N-acetylglucosamine diphosphorylase/glucosamine-1-phosphate N-acetyltransferase GlmU [Alphaproteobacteria bacterium]
MTDQNLTTLILAAGKGTRMKSSLPKVLHKLANLPMINHILNKVEKLGCTQSIIVIAPDMEQVAQAVAPIPVAIQERQLGTANAVLAVKSKLQNIQGDLLILYGDTPLIDISTLKKILDCRNSNTDTQQPSVVIVGMKPPQPNQYGRIIVNQHNDVEAIVEYSEASQEIRNLELCNSGIILVDGKIAFQLLEKIDNNNSKGEYYLTDIIKVARQHNLRCTVVEADYQELIGVNSQAELAQAEKIIQHQLREKMLNKGVSMIAPETVWLSYDTSLSENTILEPHVIFGSNVSMGKNIIIKSFSYLEGVTIGDNVTIGPFARLRPGSVIKDNVHLGNFVEIKNSIVGQASKVNHLSYIGDTEIDQNVNIGAGTITCNYDGFLKYKTYIGQGSLIGSNTSLVAPVEIGKNTVIGAGSVITQNVPDDTIAVSRAEQKNNKDAAINWRRHKQDQKILKDKK